ncbi:type VI secretion protein [Klebsiella pneumoniae]|nr:type VI secretion protein [Klebsiella pneumoniae]
MRGWLILPWRMFPCSGCLNALNSAEPVLSELHQDPSRHPELLYRELARLAGSLLTFSLEHHLEAIPRYRHASPEQVFPPLFALLDTLLEVSLPSRVIAILWSRAPTGRSGGAGCTMRGCARGRIFICRCALHSPLTSYRAAFRSSVRRVAMMMSPRSSYCPQRHRDQTAEPCAGGHSATSGKPIFRSGSLHRCRPRDAGGWQLHLLYPGIAWRRET